MAGSNLLRLGAERFDDCTEIIIGVPRLRSHVLGIGCGGYRQRLRHLTRMQMRAYVQQGMEDTEAIRGTRS